MNGENSTILSYSSIMNIFQELFVILGNFFKALLRFLFRSINKVSVTVLKKIDLYKPLKCRRVRKVRIAPRSRNRASPFRFLLKKIVESPRHILSSVAQSIKRFYIGALSSFCLLLGAIAEIPSHICNTALIIRDKLYYVIYDILGCFFTKTIKLANHFICNTSLVICDKLHYVFDDLLGCIPHPKVSKTISWFRSYTYSGVILLH